MGVARPGAPSMMTSPVTSRRIFNNFRAETDRAQPGRFGPTRCGPVCIRSLKILLLVSQDTVISGKKGQSTTKQPSWQWDFGLQKIIKQNNHKGITGGQSPATWDRTHTQSTTSNRKRKTRVSIPAFGKRSHTQTTTY